MEINRKLSLVNFTDKNSTARIKYIVIHYVGATGGAKNNADFFYNTYRGASAHYFVGHKSENAAIWQVVDDGDIAWHCGTTGTYYHASCRNSNSIGIEMCCHIENGAWYFDDETIKQAAALTKMLMSKYGIPVENVIRHYDVTHKTCPEPYVRDPAAWKDFKNMLVEPEEYTDINAIVWELAHRGIVLDSPGMVAELEASPNGRLYWLARKICHKVRLLDGKAISVSCAEYTDIDSIVWDLGYRGIVLDTAGMKQEIEQNPNGRLYWLARKGLHYLRQRD